MQLVSMCCSTSFRFVLPPTWYWPGDIDHPQPEGWYHGGGVGSGAGKYGPFSEQTDCLRDIAIRGAVDRHAKGKAMWGCKGDGIIIVEWTDYDGGVEHWIAGRPVNGAPGGIISFRVHHEGFKKFMDGELIQTALPNATPTEREFMLSGIWAPGDVWNEMFSSDEVDADV